MIKLKSGLTGCRIQGLQNELLLGLIIANDVYKSFQLDLLVTCITDSKHSSASLHYVGFAADLNRPNFDNVNMVIERLKTHLGDDFDVVLESDHIHIEFQPKRGVNLNA